MRRKQDTTPESTPTPVHSQEGIEASSEVLFDEPLAIDPTNQIDQQKDTPKLHISVESKKGHSPWQKIKIVGGLVIAGCVAAGAYEVWQALHGQDATHEYHADIEQKETKVYKDVALQLAQIESTFHLKQNTVLDRADGAFIDWNPVNYDTHIDTDITTEVQGAIVVERLEATRDDAAGTLSVVIDGELTTSTPAVDWQENELPIEIGGLDIGVGTGEINKATQSANELVQAAGGIAAACALRDESVQDLLGEGVVDFLASTSFSDGIDPQNITVTIVDIDEQSNAVYDAMIDEFDEAKSTISERYDGEENTFSVSSRNLTNCDKHTINIVSVEQ